MKKSKLFPNLIPKAPKLEIDDFVNSVDPDEANHEPLIQELQSNFDASNSFGTMKICSRQG